MLEPRRLIWPFAVMAAGLLLVAPGLGPGLTLAWRDSLRLYAPLRPVVAEAIHRGRLPLWDPYDGTGTPLFAQLLHGALHPASLGLALVAPGAPLDALLVTLILMAALGAFVAARSFGAEPAAAAAAAVGYAGCGPVLSALANLPFLAGAASGPWVLAAARRAGQGKPLGTASMGLAVAVGVFSGDVQACALVGLLGCGVAWASGGGRGLIRAVAALVLGGLLAGIQLVPSWAFLQRTSRAAGLSAEMQTQWALSPWRLLEWVIPGFMGGRPGPLVAPVFQALDGPTLFSLPFWTSAFLGCALLVVAVLGARDRASRTLAVAVPVLTWLALGHHAGAQQLLAAVPIWGGFRYSEKLLIPVALCLAMLSARGVGRLANLPRRTPGLLLAAAVVIPLVAHPVLSLVLTSVLPAAVATLALVQVDDGLVHLAGGLAGLAGLAWLGRRHPAALAPAFFAVVLAEALAASPYALHPMRKELPAPPSPAALAPGPRLCTPDRGRTDGADPDGLARAAALESALGYPGYNVAGRVDNVDLYGGMYSRRVDLLYLRLGEGRCRDLRRFGVTHVALPGGEVGPIGQVAIEGGTLLTTDANLVQVWSVPHRPWASFASSVRAEPGQGATLAVTAANLQAGRAEVVLETAVAPTVAAGRVLAVNREAERLEIEAEAEGPAVLVVADAYWPGWEARVDGAPAPIIPADVLVRAVVFPAGRHRLVMTYTPPEVPVGKAVSAVGLAALATMLWMDWRQGRKGARQTA
jgi:hypothetical protein